MTERLVVIDGNSVFYRGYYAMPNLSTKDGTPTGGVYGFAVMALEIIKRLKPTYVCVAWDKPETHIRVRREMYPAYKANRKPAPDDFKLQVPLLHQLLESLGWPLYELDDYEADDIMATFAAQAKEKDIETYLVTSDLDALQLVDSHTHIFTLKKGLSNIELFNEAHFEEKYGVGAHQWVDVKALKGDASDNIPGVAGIGEKTALDLIAKYHTLDGVYENIELLKPALKTKLEKDKDIAYLSQKLVILHRDAPIHLDFTHAKLEDGATPQFVDMLRKLEFRSLLRQVEAQQALEQPAAVQAESEKAPTAKQVAFNNLTFAADQPRVVALNPDATELWISTDSDNYATVALKDAGPAVNGPLIGHDLKAVFHALLQEKVTTSGEVAHDTRIAAFLLDSLERSLELGDLTHQTIPPDAAGQTIAAIWALYHDQQISLQAMPTVLELAHTIEFPTIYLLAKVEHRGITLDVPYLEKMSEAFATKIADMEQIMYQEAGQEFNINSPIQLGAILYEKLGLPTMGVKKGKTGAYSTGAAELDKLRGLHPIIDHITEYREYTKLKSTYIDALPKLVDQHSRLHTSYRQDVAATGRLSSNNPNLQNIPTRTELGQAIRTAFVPAKGNVFVGADYAQFELRLAAVMAGDQALIDDFNQDVDIHTKTAAEIYGVPLEQVSKNQRREAKMVNFAVLYGMSAHGLSVATGMSIIEARDFIKKYFELRKPIREYIDRTLQEALDRGYVETMFGRRRPTPDLKSTNWVVRQAAQRAAANMPIQGTEADLMKLAMLRAEPALQGLGEQLLQVHDSILVECPKANAEKVGAVLKEIMETIHPLPVKLAVEVKTGANWGEL